jgi:23S rRNA (cytidine1920-2'-O)/16S rRNA (cytidine1409-2'-O)-methyltransferase
LAADDVVPVPVQAVVIDVSFISLRQVLPSVVRWAGPNALLVALIKPQFEVGQAAIGKGGIVTSPEARQRAVDDVTVVAQKLGLTIQGIMPSPITGAKGNHEFLMVARFGTTQQPGVED